MGGNIPTEDKQQDVEAEVETTTFQGDSWKASHSFRTPVADNMVAASGQHAEGAFIASSGGYRGNDSGGVQVSVQQFDGETVAMNNYKNAVYAQDKLDNRVLLAQDQTENRAKVDAELVAEIKDRAPIASAIGANGDLKQLTAMVTKLNDGGPVAMIAGGPGVSNGAGMPASPSLKPTVKQDLALG